MSFKTAVLQGNGDRIVFLKCHAGKLDILKQKKKTEPLLHSLHKKFHGDHEYYIINKKEVNKILQKSNTKKIHMLIQEIFFKISYRKD